MDERTIDQILDDRTPLANGGRPLTASDIREQEARANIEWKALSDHLYAPFRAASEKLWRDINERIGS